MALIIKGKRRLRTLAATVPMLGLSLVATTAGTTGATAASLSHAPLLKIGSQTSGNWSGYAAQSRTANTFRGIFAAWKVPVVSRQSPTLFSSTWVGIDGDGSQQLIQCGTEEDSNGTYRAWTETLPQPEHVIPGRPVRPGDIMSAEVYHQSGYLWGMEVRDYTHKWIFKGNFTYSSPGISAEVIEEATQVNGHIGAIADFHQVQFADIAIAHGNKWYGGVLSAADKIILVHKGHAYGVPGPLAEGKQGQQFLVRYQGAAAGGIKPGWASVVQSPSAAFRA